MAIWEGGEDEPPPPAAGSDGVEAHVPVDLGKLTDPLIELFRNVGRDRGAGGLTNPADRCDHSRSSDAEQTDDGDDLDE